MKNYSSERTVVMANRLNALRSKEDETLQRVASAILEKVEFYDNCLRSWDNPGEKFSPDEVELGKKCCEAGLNMADSIVNELRILFLEEK